MDKKFIYGIGKLEFNNVVIGYIEKDSFDFGGKEGEVTEISAEQVPSAPVLVIAKSNGTISPSFNLIQLDVANLAATMGGTVDGDKWSAPTSNIRVSGAVKITTVSGAVIQIPSAVLLANLAGKLTLSETAKIAITLKVQQPANNAAPYSIDFTEENIPNG